MENCFFVVGLCWLNPGHQTKQKHYQINFSLQLNLCVGAGFRNTTREKKKNKKTRQDLVAVGPFTLNFAKPKPKPQKTK